MIRCSKSGDKWYGVIIDEIEGDELENIITLVNEGTGVLLVDSIDDFTSIINDEELETVE
jgi:hypothetical protein